MVAKGICVMLVEIVVAGKRSIVKGRSPRYGPVWQFDRIPGGACRIDIALYQVVARPYIPHLYVWQSEGRIDRPPVAGRDTTRDRHRFWAVIRPRRPSR